ncbi:hypothetical protein OG401_39290 [Kitasatospora purpeofusca]|uniref:hypothetical protein n=1 Tax=Kitasatospora purpeofusca TaxID=67352 RepID=UPI00225763C5|nr:hypothetical protein [Kitasatospora purpeofusca]MCX4690267.1 hypothetical protein [Kitasatospora purpeofusca]
MPETDDFADEQPELTVHRAADPQGDDDPAEDTQGQEPGPQAHTRADGTMYQGQM